MSKILLINGSPNEKGCTYAALCEIADTLATVSAIPAATFLNSSKKFILAHFMILYTFITKIPGTNLSKSAPGVISYPYSAYSSTSI